MEDLNLDEMRSQIAILKGKLEKESIVNDKIMRTVLKTKVNSLRVKRNIEYLCALFVIISGPISFRQSFGCSWAFLIFTDLMMLFCIVRTHQIYAPVTDKNLMAGNLFDVAKVMAEFKDQMKKWILYFSVPLITVWFAFMEWEIWNSPFRETNPQMVKTLMIVTSVSLVIGAFVGVRMTLSAVNTANEIIEQIEE